MPGLRVGPGQQHHDLLHAGASGHVEHAQHTRARIAQRRQPRFCQKAVRLAVQGR